MDELEKKYPRLFLRHKRSVQAHPDGIVTHDADCGLYNAYLNVCTCGLHHALMIIPDDAAKIYPKYWEEQAGQYKVETILKEEEYYGLWVGCPECKGEGGTGMIDCDRCEGKRVIPFAMPNPPSAEEVEARTNMIFEQFDKANQQFREGQKND